MGDKAIIVRVGKEPDHTNFTIHENLLRKASPFFEAALSRDWKESQETVVKLPNGFAPSFQVFTQWLYANRVYAKCVLDGYSDLNEGVGWAISVSSYLLGDYLQVSEFKDAVIDSIIDWANQAPSSCKAPSRSARVIYANIEEDSPSRKITLHFTLNRLMSELNAVNVQTGMPVAFLGALVSTMSTRIRTGRFIRFDFQDRKCCQYHCHQDKMCYELEHLNDLRKVSYDTTSMRHSLSIDRWDAGMNSHCSCNMR